MIAHSLDPVAQLRGVAMEGGRCTLCGSITVERALELLRQPGTTYEGFSWQRAGWPDRFVIGGELLMSEHLRDATHEQLALWNLVAQPLLGIGFVRESDSAFDLFFSAPEPDCHRAGVVA